MAPALGAVDGTVSAVRVSVTLDRTISAQRLHEDITVHVYGAQPGPLLLEVVVSSDFADLFEVRTERWQRRADLCTTWRTELPGVWRRDDTGRRRCGRSCRAGGPRRRVPLCPRRAPDADDGVAAIVRY